MPEGKGLRTLPSPPAARLLPLQLTQFMQCLETLKLLSKPSPQRLPRPGKQNVTFPIPPVVPSAFASLALHNPGQRIKTPPSKGTYSG